MPMGERNNFPRPQSKQIIDTPNLVAQIRRSAGEAAANNNTRRCSGWTDRRHAPSCTRPSAARPSWQTPCSKQLRLAWRLPACRFFGVQATGRCWKRRRHDWVAGRLQEAGRWPRTRLLAHESIGEFLAHAGWNSIRRQSMGGARSSGP
jgi:hypothetical protein